MFQLWVEAFLQIFYSLGPSWGGLITMASYNKPNNKFHRWEMIVLAFYCWSMCGSILCRIVPVIQWNFIWKNSVLGAPPTIKKSSQVFWARSCRATHTASRNFMTRRQQVLASIAQVSWPENLGIFLPKFSDATHTIKSIFYWLNIFCARSNFHYPTRRRDGRVCRIF